MTMRYEEYADYASEIGQLERMLEEFTDDTSDRYVDREDRT